MRILSLLIIIFCCFTLNAAPNNAELVVWSNEAITATYTYDSQHYLDDQKQIAHYFTPSAWIDYTGAQNKAGIPKNVQENNYAVSAVAIEPPTVTAVSNTQWKVQMPVLVVYKNDRVEQKQTLLVTLIVKEVGAGKGIRGLAIERFVSVVQKPACSCDMSK